MNRHLPDLFRLFKRLNPVRIWNIFRVYVGFWFSRATGSVIHPGWPISIAIEPTTSCNLRCPECPSGLRSFTRPTGMLDPGFFERILKELSSHALYLTFYFQGEPYLHPEFTNLVVIARKHRMYTATSTNGHYLDDERARLTVQSGLDRLIISIDGASQATYEQYRVGGNLEKVLEGAKRMVDWKRRLNSPTPHIIFQFLVVKPNEHELDQIHSLARQIGVDEVVFKTAQVYDFENGHPLIPDNARYSRYEKQSDGKWHVKSKLENHCWKMWQSCVITWDGKVVPCCFDKDGQHVMGNLQQQSFKEIWNATTYKSFRTQLLKGRKDIDICRNCSEGTSVFE